MLSNAQKMVVGLIIILGLLYYINSTEIKPIPNEGTVNLNKPNPKNMNTGIYPGGPFADTGDYYNSNSMKITKGNLKNKSRGDVLDEDEWDAYFNQNNSVTGRAQIREDNSGYKPVEASPGQYANYDVPLKKRNKITPRKLIDGSFDPDMYDPDNLLPQEEDADWFEVIDKPINLKGRLLRLENPLGINTINESLKIPNLDIRPSPPCPKMNVSPWNNSTVEPDTNIKSLY